MAKAEIVANKKRKRGGRMAGGSTSRRKTSHKLDDKKNREQLAALKKNKERKHRESCTTKTTENSLQQEWRSKCRHTIIGVCVILFLFCFKAPLKLFWKHYNPIGSSDGYAHVFCATSIGNELDCFVDVFDQNTAQPCVEQCNSKPYAYCGTLCHPDIYTMCENKHSTQLMIGGWEIYRSEYFTANMTQKNRTLTESIGTGEHSSSIHRKYISITFPDLLTSECPQMGGHVPVPNHACLWMPKLWCWLPPHTNEQVIHVCTPQRINML